MPPPPRERSRSDLILLVPRAVRPLLPMNTPCPRPSSGSARPRPSTRMADAHDHPPGRVRIAMTNAAFASRPSWGPIPQTTGGGCPADRARTAQHPPRAKHIRSPEEDGFIRIIRLYARDGRQFHTACHRRLQTAQAGQKRASGPAVGSDCGQVASLDPGSSDRPRGPETPHPARSRPVPRQLPCESGQTPAGRGDRFLG